MDSARLVAVTTISSISAACTTPEVAARAATADATAWLTLFRSNCTDLSNCFVFLPAAPITAARTTIYY